jgi:hypothetical protein
MVYFASRSRSQARDYSAYFVHQVRTQGGGARLEFDSQRARFGLVLEEGTNVNGLACAAVQGGRAVDLLHDTEVTLSADLIQNLGETEKEGGRKLKIVFEKKDRKSVTPVILTLK